MLRNHQENQVRNQKHIKNKFLIFIKIGVLNLQRCKERIFHPVKTWQSPVIYNWAFDNNKQLVTKIYKIEYFSIKVLNKDIHKFCMEKNIPVFSFNGNISHLNTTNHLNYTKYYENAEMIKIVNDYFRESKYYTFGE